MRTWRLLAAVSVLLTAVVGVHAGEVIDRIVATVNGHAILLSDWDEALRYEALVNGKLIGGATGAERKAVLDRLVDQELLRQQMEGLQYPHATQAEVDKQVDEIRRQLPGTSNDDAWRVLLGRYGFTEEDFKARVGAQLDMLRFLDVRLRPSIHVDAASVETYYREKFLPELRKSGAGDVPLAEVSPKIEELLAQQRMDELLAQWLRELRQQSAIRQTTTGDAGGAR
jgi:hypothetical protein